ncbi:type VI secretion system protein ImpB [Paraburkholderia bannensis]|uniref:Type VI secretion system protein ImpB n=1 Tax=Paraburkholderia bannensis TaxID=765414 RepID=A0A7W9WRN9_9BURK|nr:MULTISPECIES: type VI secretion system contractile sheath small subunit [Paraburkholderia]MBB3258382.1 type VI secretion system protein ImpB [Paraburkholderia sp. WP4_3_2]MBB6103395.1 type VI secretion system protein ImpB [Paraburkholderia bannensis]
MSDSTQHWFERNRPPRVQITYDVETGNAIEKKELPLVVGVMADLSGNKTLPKMTERRFVDIDRDNFNDVMKSISPRLALQVDNTLATDGSKMNVELNFKNIDDFDPVALVQQIAPLKQLYDARLRLRDLLTKLDGNDELDKLLQDVVHNTQGLTEIRAAHPAEAPVAQLPSPEGKPDAAAGANPENNPEPSGDQPAA